MHDLFGVVDIGTRTPIPEWPMAYPIKCRTASSPSDRLSEEYLVGRAPEGLSTQVSVSAIVTPSVMANRTSGSDTIFAVVDVETTGFSPFAGDRIIEIAIISVGAEGVEDNEYTTLVNPLRDVGPVHCHGITSQDVENAPTFPEIMGEVLSRFDTVLMAGHNVRYDRDFLSAEFSAAGVFLPAIPCIDTLKMAYRLHPALSNHRLETCCAAEGLDHIDRHDALADARMTAQLLNSYMREAQAVGLSLADMLYGDLVFPKPWPKLPIVGRVALRSEDGRVRADPPYLARIVASLSNIEADEHVAPYMDLLDRALEDRRVTEDESTALLQTARAWGLTAEQVVGAHNAYLHALVVAALADGIISITERQDLEAVSSLLGMTTGNLDAMVYEEARDPD